MKVESALFNVGAVLFLGIAIAYSLITGWEELVGTTALFLTAGLSIMIGGYLSFTARHIDPRPEDDDDGLIAQGAGEIGVFAPFSWQPLFVAASGGIVFLGLAVGWWLVAIGVVVSVLAVVGWVFEFYRGEHAH